MESYQLMESICSAVTLLAFKETDFFPAQEYLFVSPIIFNNCLSSPDDTPS